MCGNPSSVRRLLRRRVFCVYRVARLSRQTRPPDLPAAGLRQAGASGGRARSTQSTHHAIDAARNRRKRHSVLSTHYSPLTTEPTRPATDALFRRSCTLSFSDAKMQHTLKKVQAEVKA